MTSPQSTNTPCETQSLSGPSFVLIDFENVQPRDFTLLKEGPFEVKLFAGPQNKKIDIMVAMALQPLGPKAEYVVCESCGKGKQAIDFHIACYLGQLSASYPQAFFHIITQDLGFETLISHLKKKKIRVHRSGSIKEMPCFQKPQASVASPAPSSSAKPTDILQQVIENLRHRNGLPRTREKLENTINAIVSRTLTTDEVKEILDNLHERGIVKFRGEKAEYHLGNQV